jgi:hypothetical protein
VESVRVARHDDEHGQPANAVERVDVAAGTRLFGDDVTERRNRYPPKAAFEA